ncbi:MAG: hypothetical protein IJT54_06470 [Candidatus Methanomethylophilaceae archaeon]|nr:hypothetical protein [Candidatus Methanomethylophilaceae archaeon]
MVSDYQKRQIIVSGVMGLVLGLFISLAIWAMTDHNPISWVFIPVAAIMGIAQALISPAAKEKD